MLPFTKIFFPLLVLTLALVVACGATNPPTTATPTPEPTQTPLPTLTPFPTWTPAPAGTPLPTYTPLPTLTPVPARLVHPTYTPLPTYTPIPPTYPPTPTLGEKWSVAPGRVVTVNNLRYKFNAFWDDRKPLVLVGCHAGPSESETAVFSHDGDFNRARNMARVTGFKNPPRYNPRQGGNCYAMAVRYTGKAEYCYWTEFQKSPRPLKYGCDSRFGGWKQMTPEFRLLDPASTRFIHRNYWRRNYAKWKP